MQPEIREPLRNGNQESFLLVFSGNSYIIEGVDEAFTFITTNMRERRIVS